MQTMTDRRPQGTGMGWKFTLIELLVVVSIIAVLAAILLPALTKAKKKAYVVACSNNQSQVGLGLTTYASDWDEWFPCGKYNIPTAITTIPFTQLEREYNLTEKIFSCPEIPEAKIYRRTTTETHLPFVYVGGFGLVITDLNTYYQGWPKSAFPLFNKGVGPVVRLGLDSKFSSSRRPYFWDLSYVAPATAKPHVFNPSDRSNHSVGDGLWGRGMNILYEDGHVAWEPQQYGVSKQVFGPYDAQWAGL